jgi:hypothetical protein
MSETATVPDRILPIALFIPRPRKAGSLPARGDLGTFFIRPAKEIFTMRLVLCEVIPTAKKIWTAADA